jgi:WD40 repeat protein
VLLTDVSGGSPRVVTAPYRQRLDRLEWDLTNGTLISSALALPAALSYQWGVHGALLAQTPLNTTAAPPAPAPGPVGNPDGGAAFTLWQPGLAAPGYLRGSGGITTAPNLYLWESAFAAWSPDGRYLLTPVYAGGRVALAGQPAPSAADLAATGTTKTPILPARDTALTRLYTAMVPDASGAAPDVQSVAWRPDGSVLAATGVPYFNPDTASLAAHTMVTLYDSASGRQLTTLNPAVDLSHALGTPLTGQPIWLAWSPDGSHLLLLDAAIGTLTIWGPDALPH